MTLGGDCRGSPGGTHVRVKKEELPSAMVALCEGQRGGTGGYNWRGTKSLKNRKNRDRQLYTINNGGLGGVKRIPLEGDFGLECPNRNVTHKKYEIDTKSRTGVISWVRKEKLESLLCLMWGGIT